VSKPTFVLSAHGNTVIGPRSKVMAAVRGGHLKFTLLAQRQPHSDVAYEPTVLSYKRYECGIGADQRAKDGACNLTRSLDQTQTIKWLERLVKSGTEFATVGEA
jgi:hypothetical protein